jgi:hypothetical protein
MPLRRHQRCQANYCGAAFIPTHLQALALLFETAAAILCYHGTSLLKLYETLHLFFLA